MPPVARRDRRIAELLKQRRVLRRQLQVLQQVLQREVAALTEELDRARQANLELTQANRGLSHAAELVVRVDDPRHPRIRRLLSGPVVPSFHRHVMATRRLAGVAGSMPEGTRGPLHQVPRKLDSYRFAAGHGVTPPGVFEWWQDLAEIPWSDLPEEFVLKADGGAAGRAVQPLRRSAGDYQLVDGSRRFSPEDLRAHWEGLARTRAARPPYFAEELLADRHAAVVPVDVKIFTFYGQVAQVLLRRIRDVGRTDTADFRYLLPDGNPLTPEHWRRRQTLDIPVPEQLPEMVRIAGQLSAAVPLPFVRVDLYDVPQGVVFGELTTAPGGSRAFSKGHDAALGRMWEEAQVRLQLDLIDGRPFGMLPGPHPAELRRVAGRRLGAAQAGRRTG